MKRCFSIFTAIALLFTLASCQTRRPIPTGSEETPLSTEYPTPTYNLDVPFTPISSVRDYFELDRYTPPSQVGNILYLFHEPIRNTGKAYPLIIFLHGKGDRVDETHMGTAAPLVSTLIHLENQSEKYSAYTLVPTTPLASEGWWTDWQLSHLMYLIGYLSENYNIDANRIYVTGISMGGYTTCQLVNEMPPDTFAAAVPLSGAYDLTNPEAHYNTAFRIYHSNKDTVVNVSCSRSLAAQLKRCEHPNAAYYEYDTGNHTSALYTVYTDQSFFDWLFAQKLP